MKKNKSKKKKRMRIEISKEVSGLRAGFTLIGCFIMFLIMFLITIGDIRFFLTAEQAMGKIIDIEVHQNKTTTYYYNISYSDDDGNQKSFIYDTLNDNLKVGDSVKVCFNNDRVSYFDISKTIIPYGLCSVAFFLATLVSAKSLFNDGA